MSVRLRFILIPVLVAITPSLVGAGCNKTPPACDGDPVCEAGQIEVCLDQCVTPAAEGEECSPHPCDGSGLPPCGPRLVCDTVFPDGPRSRRVCQPFISEFDQLWCRTYDPERACPTGQYCRGFETAIDPAMRCPGLVHEERIVPPLYDGICSFPVREGRECDGNWGDVGACHACEPGTECRDDVPGWRGTRVCVRSCQGPGDCPCPSQEPNVLDVCTLAPTSGQRVCTNCIDLGAPCDASSQWGCCDADAACVDVCCIRDGASCTSTDECCGRALCASDGTCHGCTADGEPVDLMGPGCCHGTPDASGDCPITCFAGTRRVTEDAACGSGTCAGTYDCDRADGSATCRATTTAPEIFDCVDNDCDGRVDEGADRECTGRPQAFEARNFDGCPNLDPLPGQLECRDGAPVCSVTRGWCAWDSLGNPIDRSGSGKECFSGTGDCSGFNCLAGEWCCSIGGHSGNPICTRIGVIDGVEIPGHEPPPCWLPNAENTDRACPVVEDCSDHSSCGDCVADGDCGWCAGYHRCLPGSDTGPASDIECSGWYRETIECSP